MLISTGASHATVIEYDGDGNATVINLVQPEQSEASSDPPRKALSDLKPRKLSKLNLEQLVYRKLASEAALRYAGSDGVKAAGLDALTFVDVFTALVHRESNYDPSTVSTRGARGLGQLMPDTAKVLGVVNIDDNRENLDASARYFSNMLQRFGSLELALAAYNAGPTRVAKHGGVPPFRETRQYIIDIFFAVGLETDLPRNAGAVTGTTRVKPAPNPRGVTQPSKAGVQSVWEF